MKEAGASASASSGALPAPAAAGSDTHLRSRSTGARVRRAGGAVAVAGGAGGAGGEHRTRHDKPAMLSPTGAAARELRRGARALRDARDRLQRLHEKATAGEWGAEEAREGAARAAQLLRETERLQRVAAALPRDHEGAWSQEVRAELPAPPSPSPSIHAPPGALRSHSELELSRRLRDSLCMQERLAADNAAIDGKRYLLYKELVSKEQRLETARAQAARLQAELKLLARDNARLQEAVNAASTTEERSCQWEADGEAGGEPRCRCDCDLRGVEKQLSELEAEVRIMKELAEKERSGACRGGGGLNTCFKQPAGAPPMPPMQRACGVCPPCPAPCNPDAPPAPAEREAARLAAQLQQTEDSYKGKITECAMLRAEVVRRKDEAEKERCLAREAAARLRELELKFQGLATTTDMTLGTKEQAFDQEVSVRTLKRCYRETRDEVDELRALLAEQGSQLQDYRVKYLQAQQLTEEQQRQLAALDMDNTRISEQINLEIQRVKIKFQEKLQELAPVPALLQATRSRLQDAQQEQARAEHAAEQLARELAAAREKVHVLLHNSLKPPADKAPERGADEKLLAAAQQRAAQLLEANAALGAEIERYKINVIRMEEQVLASDKRLQDKMAECGALGRDLDRVRDEAARAVLRAHQRQDAVRKCMQTSVAELERQLAASRAQVATEEKEREELQSRMRAQIQRLQENFEQAQLRVRSLTAQVMMLRKRADTEDDADDGQGDAQECACKTFFEN